MRELTLGASMPGTHTLLARPMLDLPDDDAPLVRRCQQGDLAAFGTLVTRHEKRVRTLVERVLGGGAVPEDVEDTVQEVFVQAWRALSRFRGDARFSTWLYRIATNQSIKVWHGRKRRSWLSLQSELPEAAANTQSDPGIGPEAAAMQEAQSRALRAAIDSLSEKHRTVTLLHYFEDFSCEEIASIVGCSVGTVWSRLHYACKKLKSKLAWLEPANL